MSPPIGTLGAVAAPRFDGAACAGRWALFDPPEAEDPDRPDLSAQALAVCRSCPALPACGAWLESLPPARRPTGIVAGVRVDSRGQLHQPITPSTEGMNP